MENIHEGAGAREVVKLVAVPEGKLPCPEFGDIDQSTLVRESPGGIQRAKVAPFTTEALASVKESDTTQSGEMVKA
jgi:hypothetical protein